MAENITIGESLNANRFSNIYFSGQPKKKDLLRLKEQGFKTIINLRGPKEYDENVERQLISEEGLSYYNIPFYADANLSDEYIQKVTQTVMKHRKDGKLLIHCSAGDRVGVWLAGHFYKDHKFSQDKSLEMAKKLGLNNPQAITKVRNYFAAEDI